MRRNASLGAVTTFFTFLLTLGTSTTPAYSYELLLTEGGTPLSRTSSTTEFFVQDILDLENAKAVRMAIDQWHHRIGSVLPVRYTGQITNVEASVSSEVFVLPLWSEEYGPLDETIAHTRLVYDSATGVISQSDILLNGEAFKFGQTNSVFDTQSVVLHELGHAFGFAHSCGEAGRTYASCFQVNDLEILEAVMAPTLPLGTKRLQFSLDDIEGMRAVYGSILAEHQPNLPLMVERDCESQRLRANFALPPTPTRVTARTIDGHLIELDFQLENGAQVVIDLPDSVLEQNIDLWFRWSEPSAVSVMYDVSTYKNVSCSNNPDHNSTQQNDDLEPSTETTCSCKTTDSKESPNFVFLFILLGIIMKIVPRNHRSLFVLVGLIFALAPSKADAYRCTRVGNTVGPSLIWQERNIDWYLGEEVTQDFGNDAQVVETVKNSFASWENQTCSDLSFSYKGQKPNLRARFNENGLNENVVVFVRQGWIHQPGVVALTLNAFDRASGSILDTDIEVNDEFFKWGSTDGMCSIEMDLENALVHEIGHFIGLSHPPNTPEFEETTMFASAEPCEVKKRTLESDDIEGLCAIYPKGQPNKQCFPPEGPGFVQVDKDLGYGCQSTQTGHRDLWLLVLLLFGFLRNYRVK